MRDRIKEGILLIVVDRNGVQIYSAELGGWNAYDYDSQHELGKRIAEGLPDEAYEIQEGEKLSPGIYESYYGNAVAWDGFTAYDLDMGEDVPFGVILKDRYIRPLD